MRDERGVSRGFGFVCYKKSDDATKAVTAALVEAGVPANKANRWTECQGVFFIMAPAVATPVATTAIATATATRPHCGRHSARARALHELRGAPRRRSSRGSAAGACNRAG